MDRLENDKSIDATKERFLSLGIIDDNDYFKKYIQLITDNKQTKKQKHKTQRHHIIPKSYYKHKKIEVDNSSDNLVNLLYKDHILAHYYLCLCVSLEELKYPFLLAFIYLINRVDALKNTQIDNLLLQIEDSKDDIIRSLDHYQQLYEELKMLHGAKTKGKVPHNKGKKCDMGRWMTNGLINKRIKDIDAQSFLDAGWTYGRYNIDDIVAKFSSAMKGRPSPTKGSTLSDEQKEKIRQANLGKKQSSETIQKRRKKLIGQTRTNEAKAKMSVAQKGHTVSDEARQKMSASRKGKSPPNKGVPMSDEQKIKLSKAQKGKIWITNGTEDRLILPDDLSFCENMGFYKGRSYSQK